MARCGAAQAHVGGSGAVALHDCVSTYSEYQNA